MAQEIEILIEVSSNGTTWTELTRQPAGTVTFNNTGLTLGTTKYYRAKAIGNGTTTLDSAYTSIVSATSSFCSEYQAVLNHAVANSIGTPSLAQNIINDIVVRQLLKLGQWNEFDVFYYFKQETGTPYEFMTLNWKKPASFRLLNAGANNVSFVGGSGFKVAGGNNQYFNTQWNPATNAVKCTLTSNSVIFKTFDIPTTYVTPSRIVGGKGANTAQVNIANTGSPSFFLSRIYQDSTTTNYNPTQTNINSHFHISNKSTVKNHFRNGVIDVTTAEPTQNLTNAPMHVFGYNNNGTAFPSEASCGLSYLAFGSDLNRVDNYIYKILNQNYTFTKSSPDSVLGFTTGSSVLPSIFALQITKASKFPTLTTTKKYIVLYSTDHSNASPTETNGAICWGECDQLNLSGFVERGVIISGYQSETPHLELVPSDPDGQTVHLYYHPDTTHPDSAGKQQTRLLTTTGGTLHTATWTDRGKILGITAYETAHPTVHTGYLVTFPQTDGTFIGVHSVKGWDADTAVGVPKIGVSTSLNGRSWTRISEDIGGTAFMSYFRQFHITRAFFFVRGGTQYALGCSTTYNFDWTQVFIGIARCDGNYNLVEYLGNISTPNSGNGCTNASFYIDSESLDVLHIYYTVAKTSVRYTTFDLKNLD